jgi:tagatose 6-phosphate kinase
MLLCVGLTPTVQRTMFFDRFAVGAVNRARETLVTASGKGVNVARVTTLLGEPARLIQILGGDSGRWVAQTLDAEEVPHHTVWADDDAPTRTCTTLLAADGPTTELVEEARSVEPHDVSLLLAACRTALLEAKAVCLSGSLPPGVPPTFYAEVARAAMEVGVPVIADAQKAPLAEVLKQRPFLVKPNREEAAATLGFPLTGDPLADARTAIRSLTNAGARWALVSMGSAGSLLGGDGEDALWRVTPPRVDAVNPIGSGDSLAAGTLVAHALRGLPVPEAVAYGTACAAANCLTATSGVVRREDVERLLPQVTLERLT